MRTRRLLGAAALSTVVVVGLSGCMKIDMQLELNSDDTVDGTMIMAISKEMAEMMGQDPAALAEEMAGDLTPEEGDPGEYSQKPYDDGEYVGTEVTITGSSLEAMEGTTSETGELQIVRDGDEFVVSGEMDLSEEAMGGGGEDLGFDLSESFDVRIAITFPGKVSEHDGELSGNTVTWTPKFGEVTPVNARGSAVDGGGGGDLPIALIAGIAVAVLLLIGLVLFFVLRGRKKAAPAVATGYPTEGYAGYTPTAAPGETYAPAPPAQPTQAYPQTGYAQPTEAAPYTPPQTPPAPPAPPTPPAPPAPPAG